MPSRYVERDPNPTFARILTHVAARDEPFVYAFAKVQSAPGKGKVLTEPWQVTLRDKNVEPESSEERRLRPLTIGQIVTRELQAVQGHRLTRELSDITAEWINSHAKGVGLLAVVHSIEVPRHGSVEMAYEIDRR